MPMLINELENAEFRQIMLILTNVLWLALSNLYFDHSWAAKYSIIRMIYFFILSVCRTETTFIQNPAGNIDVVDERVELPFCGSFTHDQWKACKVFFTDMAMWMFMAWAFGLSFLPDYGWALFQAGFCLSLMSLPERVYMPQSTWAMQCTMRTPDFKKHWVRKANLQMIAVPLGALMGALPSLMDSPSLKSEDILPTGPIDGAVLASTIVNFANYMFYTF